MVEVATVLAETEKFNPTCEQHPGEIIDSYCLQGNLRAISAVEYFSFWGVFS